MATKTTCTTTAGVFATREAADQAIAALKAAGYRDDQIGMIAKDASGNTTHTDGDGNNYAGTGAAVGMAAGAATGAAIGAGVAMGVIPVIGPVLAIGTLGTVLLNAAGGAAIASLAGALVGYGIPEEDAQYYEGEVKAGRYLVTVNADDRTADVRSVYTKHGGYDRSTARTSSARTSSSQASASGANQTIKVHEERLHATKTPVKTGEVSVRKEVHTEQKTINVPVTREEVVIERRPASGNASASDLRPGEEIRIPVKEEKVHVHKETVVKEEVNVGKRKVTETEQVGGTVRKEEVRVESEGNVEVRDSSKKRK